MTAAEKQKTASFINLAGDFISTGYRSKYIEYDFNDDEENYSAHSIEKNDETVFDMQDAKVDFIDKIAEKIKICRNCALAEKRINTVPGEGVKEPLVMVIGEGPGADEDATGRPFVGKAGQLLDKMLASIDLSRDSNCFIANIVKCRPPNNREPFPDEASACEHFLHQQIVSLKPKYILCAGGVSSKNLLKTSNSVAKLRGKFFDFEIENLKIPVLVTYHPSALLHNDAYKRPAWEDLKLLRSSISDEHKIS